MANKEKRIQELERKMEEPDFWDKPEESQEAMKTLNVPPPFSVPSFATSLYLNV